MRDLNAVEMEFVAGGRASGALVKTAHTVALASGKGAALKKISSHAAANLSGDTVAHPDEEIVDDGGGDGGGGDDSGGGDSGGDAGGGGGSSGGDMGDNAWVDEQGEPPSGDHLLQVVEDNGPITSTCKGTSGGGSQCIMGTANDFVVTTTDSHSNIISQIQCTKDTGWSVELAVSFIKGLFDGIHVVGKDIPGFTCTPVKK